MSDKKIQGRARELTDAILEALGLPTNPKLQDKMIEEAIIRAYQDFCQGLQLMDAHVPAIVICIHGRVDDTTHIIAEDNDTGIKYKEALSDMTNLMGGKDHIERKI